jgi:hypothetical protein
VEVIAVHSKKEKPEVPEILAWERFERAVDAAVKSGPKHRASRQKIESLRPPGSPIYEKAVIVIGAVNEGGKWRPFEGLGK